MREEGAMSEHVLIAMILSGAGALATFFIALFASSNGHSNFETLIESWEKKRIAELEVEKLKAQHERVCPRLTDKPRGS